MLIYVSVWQLYYYCISPIERVIREKYRNLICQEQSVHQSLMVTTIMQTFGNVLHINFYYFFRVNIGNSLKLCNYLIYKSLYKENLTSSLEKKKYSESQTQHKIRSLFLILIFHTENSCQCVL